MPPPDFTPEDNKLIEAIDAALAAGKTAVAEEITSVLRQNRMRRQPLPEPVNLGQAGMPDAIKETVRDQYGKTAQAFAGAGSAPMVAGHAIAQLAGADNKADAQNWQAVARATPHTTGGNLAGNVGMFGALPAGAIGTGMNIAGRTIPRWGGVADMAATQGGLAAITTPGDAAERTTAGMLGVGGAAVPGVMAAAQTGRRAMNIKGGKELDYAEMLRRELGPEAKGLETSLLAPYPGAAYGVRPSAAMLTRNPTLEVMETGSRTRLSDRWVPFDRLNADMRWRAIEEAAGTQKELEVIKAARDALTSRSRNTAIGGANRSMAAQVDDMDIGIRETLDALKTQGQRPNKDVQTMVGYVESELEKGVTPEQLYTIRKVLTDGIKSGQGNELTQAARAARPQRMQIIGKIDEALDNLSDGAWTRYLEDYKQASPLINSREALLDIKAHLEKNLSPGTVPPVMGEKVRPTALGTALRLYGEKAFGTKNIDQLLPADRQLLATMLKDMENQAGVLSSATKMGSPTAPLMANASRVSGVTNAVLDEAGRMAPIVGSTVAASAKGSMARANEESLAALLQNPQGLSDAMRKALASAELLRKSGRAGAAADAGYRTGRE